MLQLRAPACARAGDSSSSGSVTESHVPIARKGIASSDAQSDADVAPRLTSSPPQPGAVLCSAASTHTGAHGRTRAYTGAHTAREALRSTRSAMPTDPARSSLTTTNDNNNNNGYLARRGPVPASAPASRTAAVTGAQTPATLSAHAGQRAQTSPRRTPRAALSVSSAAPSGRRPAAATAPLTPALSSAQLKAHQLVRTPASRRRRERTTPSAAGPAAVAKSRWRASLAGVLGPEAAAKLAERQEVVRVTASDALEELLEVGLDAVGAENGNYAISETTQTLVTVFQGNNCHPARGMQTLGTEPCTLSGPQTTGSKSKYLSDAPFLETRTIAHVLPQEVNDPNSRLNTLVRICNLTTFMHLVLSAAPDPKTGVSSREGLAKLRQAADAMLRHVKPPQDPITDATLKLLVDLKCQVCRSAHRALWRTVPQVLEVTFRTRLTRQCWRMDRCTSPPRLSPEAVWTPLHTSPRHFLLTCPMPPRSR